MTIAQPGSLIKWSTLAIMTETMIGIKIGISQLEKSVQDSEVP